MYVYNSNNINPVKELYYFPTQPNLLTTIVCYNVMCLGGLFIRAQLSNELFQRGQNSFIGRISFLVVTVIFQHHVVFYDRTMNHEPSCFFEKSVEITYLFVHGTFVIGRCHPRDDLLQICNGFFLLQELFDSS